jgi:hypothetical protein
MSRAFPFSYCSLALAYYEYLSMEQHTLKKGNNYLNTNIYSFLETFGGQSSILYLNVVHFFNTSIKWTCVTA